VGKLIDILQGLEEPYNTFLGIYSLLNLNWQAKFSEVYYSLQMGKYLSEVAGKTLATKYFCQKMAEDLSKPSIGSSG
jgi:hypothetical protein